MSSERFNEVTAPHEQDTSLIERCHEELRNYNIYSAFIDPRNHTISYIAAAYLDLAKKYDDLVKKLEDK